LFISENFIGKIKDTLSKKEREFYNLRYSENRSLKEISVINGMSLSSNKAMNIKIKKKISEFIKNL
jgi:DNA-directed RNA polymerase specialized sigma subunit